MNSELPIDSGVYSILSMKQLASLENLGGLKNDAILGSWGEVKGAGEKYCFMAVGGDGRHCR
jgi:hypothetical protein